MDRIIKALAGLATLFCALCPHGNCRGHLGPRQVRHQARWATGAVASCACSRCELGPSAWPVGLGSDVAASSASPSTSWCWRVPCQNSQAARRRAPVGWTPAWVGRPLVRAHQPQRIVVRVHAAQLVPGPHGRAPDVYRRHEHCNGSRVVRAPQVAHVLQGGLRHGCMITAGAGARARARNLLSAALA
jgi:hypothetical protein